jgi:hypothetical protein
MVAEVRRGRSMRSVARTFRVTLDTVRRWVTRAADYHLDDVDWSDRASGSRLSSRRTKRSVEQRVLSIRRVLKTKSDLGEYGAGAIRREMLARNQRTVPSLRTIGRILERGGALDGRRRMRHKAPPRGWFLSDVRAQRAELDSFDMIEDLSLRGGRPVNVLTGISLHGALCAAWAAAEITAKYTVESLIEHWRQFGLPGYAKFDNGTIFLGNRRPNSFGRVIRLCLSLNVTPVFAPPLSRGFQADIEAFNRRWQEAVWHRFTFRNRDGVRTQSQRFVVAHRDRHAVRIEDAPKRRPFPASWQFDLKRPLQGVVIFIRVTSPSGRATILDQAFDVSPTWCGRLVRAEVDLTAQEIRFYALRRKDPDNHVLLVTHPYKPPTKPFWE